MTHRYTTNVYTFGETQNRSKEFLVHTLTMNTKLDRLQKGEGKGRGDWGACLGSSTSWTPHCSTKNHKAGGEEQSWCQTQNKLQSPQWDMGS